MQPVTAIAFWSVLFIGSHLLISSQLVRPRLAAAIGEWPYRGLYSLISFATLGPLVTTFARHKHAGAMIWSLRSVAPMRFLTWALMFAALLILVAGLIHPSPAAIVAPAEPGANANGVLKLTRHPAFVGLALFGGAHLLMNGWVGDIIFFGTFPALGILGGIHQDRRKLRELGDSYRRFLAGTSFLPGAALIGGRQRWTAADTPWIAIGVGSALGVILILIHPYAFGGMPAG